MVIKIKDEHELIFQRNKAAQAKTEEMMLEEPKSSKKEESNWFKKNWKYILGFVVTVGLMTVLILTSNPKLIWKNLMESKGWLILAAFGVTIILFVIKTLRWMAIIKQQGEKIPFFEAFSLILIGTFGSAITPAKVGDILRAFYLTKKRKSIKTGTAVFSVVFDRILDLAGILIVVAVSLPFIFMNLNNIEWWIPASIAGGFMIFIVILVLVFSKKITKPILTFLIKFISKMFKKKEAKDKINISSQEIVDDFYTCQKNYRFKHYLWLGFLSLLFWIILGLQGGLLLYAFGAVGIDLSIVIMTICVAAIVAMTVPITISGVGVRDSIIVAFLLLLNEIERTISISLSITQTFINVLLPGIIGGILLLTITKIWNRKKAHAVPA